MENQNKRLVDLAVSAGRKRQSPRTGFIHFFPAEETISDTIALFENFCFVVALFRQKSVESILEGKELLEKLLAFQTPEGNFPIYLHEFPKCYDPWMALRVAPVLVQIERRFGTVIGSDLKEKITASLARLLKFAESRARPAVWEHRFLKLQGKDADFTPSSHDDWFLWLISEQLDLSPAFREIPYHPDLQAFIGGAEIQEKGEPRPVPIEWVLAESEGFSERLLRDHPAMLHSALLFPIESPSVLPRTSCLLIQDGVRLLWREKKLHSFSVPQGIFKEPGKVFFELKGPVFVEKGDLIEAAAFCDISPETELTIEGKKGTVFQLGDPIEIRTPLLTIELKFELLEGSGDFCGQISRKNRPAQIACKGALLYEAFDWQIALRTLRRSPDCLVALSIKTVIH